MDNLIKRTENPSEFLRTIIDPLNQKKVVLTNAQINLVRSIVRGTSIGGAVKQPWDVKRNPEDDKKGVLYWGVEKAKGSMHAAPEPKRRFMPSKHERNTVNKLVYAIKRGWIDLDQRKEEEAKREKLVNKEFNEEDFLEELEDLGDAWVNQSENQKRLDALVAPGFDLPDHTDSFNPPPEFFENPKQCKFFTFCLKQMLILFVHL